MLRVVTAPAVFLSMALKMALNSEMWRDAVFTGNICRSLLNHGRHCTVESYRPDSRHGICQKAYTGKVFKDQILPKSL